MNSMAGKVTLVVVLLAFMFLWFLGNYDFIITTRAVDDLETPRDVAVYEGGGFCGDSIRQLGEDCSSCPTDIKCSSNAYCDNGVCIPKKTFDNSLLYIALIIIFFCGISLSAYLILNGRRKKKESKEEDKVKEIKEEKKEEREIVVNYDELENYVENALKNGYSKGQIKDLLLKSGWEERDVDFVFRHFNQK